MLVKELQKILTQFNPDANSSLTTSEDIALSYISIDPNGRKLSRMETLQVFIEGVDCCNDCAWAYMDNEEIKQCSFYDMGCDLVEECYQYEEVDSNEF